jgi:hypothetical protein
MRDGETDSGLRNVFDKAKEDSYSVEITSVTTVCLPRSEHPRGLGFST